MVIYLIALTISFFPLGPGKTTTSKPIDLRSLLNCPGYGDNGWGNNEWQLYTNNNAKVVDGSLIITAKKESNTIGKRNGSITSSRLTTQGKVTVGPGMRVEAKIKGPWGQGIWPAFWTIGANFPDVGWPSCGEIDILEYAGGNPLSNDKNKINFSTHHWSHNGSHASYGNSITPVSYTHLTLPTKRIV